MNWHLISGVAVCVLGGIQIGRALEYQNPIETSRLFLGFGLLLVGIGEIVFPYSWKVSLPLVLGGFLLMLVAVGTLWAAGRKANMNMVRQTGRWRLLDALLILLSSLALMIPTARQALCRSSTQRSACGFALG